MEDMPCMHWTSWTAQCINLMMKDFGHLLWFKSVVEKVQAISKYIYNYTWILALPWAPTMDKISYCLSIGYLEVYIQSYIDPCTNEAASGWGANEAKCDTVRLRVWSLEEPP